MFALMRATVRSPMITIFVSSTFRDMQAERDVLQTQVAPFVNEQAEEYGESVDFCDLRWGINTIDMDSDAGSRKVLDVCLDEIDRCQPPMVVLLGYRYGWLPDTALIESVAERKHLELDDLEKSVTALEIEYGAFKRNSGNTLFYFREFEGEHPGLYDAEDERAARRLNELKQRIRDLSAGMVKEYTVRWNGAGLEGVEQFAETVRNDVWRMLLPRLEADRKKDPFEREFDLHRKYFAMEADNFTTRGDLADSLVERARESRYLAIEGEEGSGKTTLLAHMTRRFEEEGYEVLPIECGLTQHSGTALELLRVMIHFVGRCIGDDIFWDTELYPNKEIESMLDEVKEMWQWRGVFYTACMHAGKQGKKMAVLIDGVDSLLADDARDSRCFLPRALTRFDGLAVVYTSRPGMYAEPNAVRLASLDPEEQRAVVASSLSRIHRELAPVVQQHMMSKASASNPLYISLLLKRLVLLREEDFVHMDNADTITEYQCRVIDECPDSLLEMFVHLLTVASAQVDAALIPDVLAYMTFTSEGIRVSDLAALCADHWSQLSFTRFIHYMNDCFFLRRDGRYDFAHDGIRMAFIDRYGFHNEYVSRLVDHWFTLSVKDGVRRQELPAALILSERYEDLAQYIVYCDNKKRRKSQTELVKNMVTWALHDEGALFYRLFDTEVFREDAHKLIDFAVFYFLREFPCGERARQINIAITERLYALCRDMYEKDASFDSVRRLHLLSIRLGRANRSLGTIESVGKAIALYREALASAQQLLEMKQKDIYEDWLRVSYYNLAKTLYDFGGRDNMLEALDCARKASAIARTRSEALPDDKGRLKTHANMLICVADVLMELEGLSNVREAYGLYKEAGDCVFTRKDKDDENIIDWDEQSDYYTLSKKMAMCLMTCGDRAGLINAQMNLENGMELCAGKYESTEDPKYIFDIMSFCELMHLRAQQLWQTVFTQLDTYHKMAVDYSAEILHYGIAARERLLGDVCRHMSVKRYDSAISYYRHALDLLSQASTDTLKWRNSAGDLAMIHRRLGYALFLEDGPTEEAISWLRQALREYNEWYELRGKPSLMYDVAETQSALAEVLCAAGEANRAEGLRLAREAVELCRTTHLQTELYIDRKAIASAIETLAGLLQTESDDASAEEALALSRESLSMRKEVYWFQQKKSLAGESTAVRLGAVVYLRDNDAIYALAKAYRLLAECMERCNEGKRVLVRAYCRSAHYYKEAFMCWEYPCVKDEGMEMYRRAARYAGPFDGACVSRRTKILASAVPTERLPKWKRKQRQEREQEPQMEDYGITAEVIQKEDIPAIGTFVPIEGQ